MITISAATVGFLLLIVLMSLGWWISGRYPLTRPVCERMQVQLWEQRAAAGLTDDSADSR